MTVLVIILVGVAAGILSGLIGLGGGVLMVPFLYFFYDRPDLFGVAVSPEARVVVAHGTSLFAIIPTSVRGVVSFHRAGLVRWPAVWPIGLASVVSAIVGARLAVVLPPELLKTGFGILLVALGLRLVLRHRPAMAGAVPASPRLSLPRTVIAGGVIGLFSALLGVGGGTVGIPLLIYFLRLDVREVAATSIAVIGLTSTAGTLSYVANGLGQPGLPPWSLGYVHVAAGLALFIGSVASVRWGTSLNQRLKPRTLEIIFGVVFFSLGLQLAAGNLLALARGAIEG